ncbi:MAG TPA: HAD family hydrolase [Candidatus Hydrogenedentes bacterium]|nr:HAD family hydrolase [Candidatus Hydrogenedentota bacterium]HPG67020.1 HAD family hydrolase [Candidatus Hydrogenedentota bacterium]
MPIRAISFDLWCTLFRDAHSAERQDIRIDAFTAATGLPRDDVVEALRRAWIEFDRSHREDQRTLEPIDAVTLAAGVLDVPIDGETAEELAEVFATAILAYPPEPIDGALEAVQAAAARVPIAIICDAGVSPGSSLRVLLDRHGFTPYFTVLNFSNEVGVAKPQRSMFETAARALGVHASELLHIGDLEYSDIAGAKAFGAKAALFAGNNPRFLETTAADLTFTHWRQFIDALPDLLEP